MQSQPHWWREGRINPVVRNALLYIEVKSDYLNFLLPVHMTRISKIIAVVVLVPFFPVISGAISEIVTHEGGTKHHIHLQQAFQLANLIKIFLVGAKIGFTILQEYVGPFLLCIGKGEKRVVAKRFELLHLTIPENPSF